MKIMTILGTRPEIIRLSRVMHLLEEHVEHVLVHTGQNYDYELNEVFFSDLGVKQPDHFLAVDTTSLGTVYGDLLIKSELVLKQEKPDAVLILGDTNSALAAIIAKRLHIPIYHMEAGNRCFDWRVPEEVNRHIVDAISDINLVYTEHARRNLLAEGFPASKIFLTGSPMAEVLESYKKDIENSTILAEEELIEKKYFLVSLHREENVDDPKCLNMLVDSLKQLELEFELPILVSLHPRTAKQLQHNGIEFSQDSLIRLQKPYGFFDYNSLQMNALCVLSDSGTLSEEASILNFAGVTPRVSFERPEGLDAGRIVVCGADPSDVIRAIKYSINRPVENLSIPLEYQVKDTANRVLSCLLSRPLA